GHADAGARAGALAAPRGRRGGAPRARRPRRGRRARAAGAGRAALGRGLPGGAARLGVRRRYEDPGRRLFVLLCQRSGREVGFSTYGHLTYEEALEQEPGFCKWVLRESQKDAGLLQVGGAGEPERRRQREVDGLRRVVAEAWR
ncbi:unnamed protein product, partial [Prorocentrum cordatum]